jgi:hypothetical protein
MADEVLCRYPLRPRRAHSARGRDLFLTLGQQSDPLAPPAGRGRRCRRFLFRECRIGATLAPTAPAPAIATALRGRQACEK